MYTRRDIRFKVIVRFAWKNIIIFLFWSTLVTFLFIYFLSKGTNIGIPFLPLTTIGIAVAFYLGFKNSQSYDRFWEGRKIWGGIVNYSRTWGNQVLSFIQNHPDSKMTDEELINIKEAMVRRQLAWINSLRIQLRNTTIFDRKNISYTPDFGLKNDRECKDCIAFFLPEGEYEQVNDKANTAVHIIRKQGDILDELNKKGLVNHFRHIDMMKSLEEFYNLQGKCERIKNTPFPRQYAYFSSIFVWIFIFLLPFGLVEQFNEIKGQASVWLTIPFTVLIAWVFSTMEAVGDNSEDPFENYVNDVPISAICRTIEIDLLQMIGAKNIPPKLQPIDDVLL
ncbi:bestrophin family protein [Flexithrix dorotheae]|uniref:bestrophin family protein n=1 Tax=Flexithrix dorotheae TaxID=70993 RepID=UPI00036BC3B2|nr:bestrophin family ion channel [Flexithrix dorotheae]